MVFFLEIVEQLHLTFVFQIFCKCHELTEATLNLESYLQESPENVGFLLSSLSASFLAGRHNRMDG
jgi:hypothetical protein